MSKIRFCCIFLTFFIGPIFHSNAKHSLSSIEELTALVWDKIESSILVTKTEWKDVKSNNSNLIQKEGLINFINEEYKILWTYNKEKKMHVFMLSHSSGSKNECQSYMNKISKLINQKPVASIDRTIDIENAEFEMINMKKQFVIGDTLLDIICLFDIAGIKVTKNDSSLHDKNLIPLECNLKIDGLNKSLYFYIDEKEKELLKLNKLRVAKSFSNFNKNFISFEAGGITYSIDRLSGEFSAVAKDNKFLGTCKKKQEHAPKF